MNEFVLGGVMVHDIFTRLLYPRGLALVKLAVVANMGTVR